MARKISVSFKETTKDLELYNTLMDMEDKSCEIKQLIRMALETSERPKDKQNETKAKHSDINILDF